MDFRGGSPILGASAMAEHGGVGATDLPCRTDPHSVTAARSRARPRTGMSRRMQFVVVADDPVRALAAADQLRAEGYPRCGVVGSEELESECARPVAVVAARDLPAALDACRSIRARALAATILLLAASDGDAARAAGADFFWASNWDVAAVAEQAHKFANPGALRVSEGRLFLNDRPLELRGRPLLLARHLVARAYEPADDDLSKRVNPVSRGELKRIGWGDEAVTNHTLHQTMHVVRRALGAEGARLSAVAKRGYWLDVV